jgi:hypothetical protein
MRTPMPLRWIEEAEARQVLATAQCEAPAPPVAPIAAKAPWGERVRRWVAAGPASRNPEPLPAGSTEANAGPTAAV